MRHAALAAIALAGCGLFPDVGGLAPDASAEASIADATDEDAGADAVAVPDANGDSPAPSAPHVVGVWNAIDESTTFGTSLDVSVSNAAGDALVACVREGYDDTDAFTVTDSANQAWTQTKSGYLSVNTVARAGCFWIASSASVTTVTAKYATQGGVNVRTITVVAIADAAASNLEDVSVGQGAISDGVGSSLQSGAITTTNANDLLLFYVALGDDATAWTAGTGYTIPSNSNAAGASGSNPRTAVETTTLSAVQTNTTATMSWSPVLGSGHSLLGIFVALRGNP